jgi:hypothetical protein
MRVSFRKTHRRGYAVDIFRTHADDLTMNPAPGYDDLLPHDLVHLLVELHWDLRDGIYGSVAAGGNAGTFRLSDERPPSESVRAHARAARRARRSRGGADMARSEHLAGVVHARWNTAHHGTAIPDWYPNALAASDVTEAEIAAVLREAEVLSERWRRLQVGEAMQLEWPFREGARR